LLTAVKNYNKSFEKLQDFFFKTETKTKIKCSRPRPRLHDPRLHDPRPRLSFLFSRHLETKTLVSRTTSLSFTDKMHNLKLKIWSQESVLIKATVCVCYQYTRHPYMLKNSPSTGQNLWLVNSKCCKLNYAIILTEYIHSILTAIFQAKWTWVSQFPPWFSFFIYS